MSGRDPLLGAQRGLGPARRAASDPALTESRRRQRARAIIMAVLLAAFVILIYAISIARMTLGH